MGIGTTAQCGRVTIVTTISILCCLIGACSKELLRPPPSKTKYAWINPSNRAYRLKPRDVIDIKFFFQPALNEIVEIRPDGRISLQLVGDLQAAGQTTESLRKELRKRYSKHIQTPEVAVIVREFSPAMIFVGGEVVAPKMLEIRNRVTPIQAIFQAGGFRETADPDNVILIRDNGRGKANFYRVALDNTLEGQETQPPVFLQPSDVLFVPRSTIANINLALKQFIYNNLPVSLGVTYGIWAPN